MIITAFSGYVIGVLYGAVIGAVFMKAWMVRHERA